MDPKNIFKIKRLIRDVEELEEALDLFVENGCHTEVAAHYGKDSKRVPLPKGFNERIAQMIRDEIADIHKKMEAL